MSMQGRNWSESRTHPVGRMRPFQIHHLEINVPTLKATLLGLRAHLGMARQDKTLVRVQDASRSRNTSGYIIPPGLALGPERRTCFRVTANQSRPTHNQDCSGGQEKIHVGGGGANRAFLIVPCILLVWCTHAGMGHHMFCFLGTLPRTCTCTCTWYFPGTPTR